MVPMKDPNATTVSLPSSDSEFCVTTNTSRQRVDVTDGGCREISGDEDGGPRHDGCGCRDGSDRVSQGDGVAARGSQDRRRADVGEVVATADAFRK